MKDRISNERLEDLVIHLKGRSMGRMDGDTCRFSGREIRTLIEVCKDLEDARALLEKTAWLRKPQKKAKKCPE